VAKFFLFSRSSLQALTYEALQALRIASVVCWPPPIHYKIKQRLFGGLHTTFPVFKAFGAYERRYVHEGQNRQMI